MTVYVILAFSFAVLGILLGAWIYRNNGKRANMFKDIYFSVEKDQKSGFSVIYTKLGYNSVVLKMQNPVPEYCGDMERYEDFNRLIDSIISILGEGYSLHKQDVKVKKTFTEKDLERLRDGKESLSFLTESNFRTYLGRTYKETQTYLVITEEKRKGGMFTYSEHDWTQFCDKVRKVIMKMESQKVRVAPLGLEETRVYVDRIFAMNFRDEHFAANNFQVYKNGTGVGIGDRQFKIFSLIDIDDVGLPGVLNPYSQLEINGSVMPVDLVFDIGNIPDVDLTIYNQIIYLPKQSKILNALRKKRNRHKSFSSPNNQVAVDDIDKVEEIIAKDKKLLVYCNFNIIVATDAKKDMRKITNNLENLFSKQNMRISQQAYNQLELFRGSFPGNVYDLNEEYDRFLTFADAAVCLMYKECPQSGDRTQTRVYFTDRQGFPIGIDITGMEVHAPDTNDPLTTNSNFFVLGPSGSGKSFYTNTFVRQMFEQGAEVVIVDTGDSYEGIAGYFDAAYISYTKERPISMNPFKISKKEYEENFEGKKNSLKSLVFLIYSSGKTTGNLEESIISKVIDDYYKEYFHPFQGFNEDEKELLKQKLLLESKKNGEYDAFEEELQTRNGTGTYDITEEDRSLNERLLKAKLENVDHDKFTGDKDLHRVAVLQEMIENPTTTVGERQAAKRVMNRLLPVVVENKFLLKIEKQVQKIERQRRSLKVKELNFNSFYDYAIQRIPQIMDESKVTFPINDFGMILSKFYKGGEYEYVLNNDMDGSLFDERFIVFEVDKIKDNATLFPIVILIIMDVFSQKMFMKKCWKMLVIEEAWKAISTPVMAEYIKYLYKTARKHKAMVGVVTQDLDDIISSPIVKEAIISNSELMMLLDQYKFRSKFDAIQKTLGLTDADRSKIFTINQLQNKEGRNAFKEVFIKRGPLSMVVGVEESKESYMCYTTNKEEKEAFRIYRRRFGDVEKATRHFVDDWKASGIAASFEFSKKVNAAGKVLSDKD